MLWATAHGEPLSHKHIVYTTWPGLQKVSREYPRAQELAPQGHPATAGDRGSLNHRRGAARHAQCVGVWAVMQQQQQRHLQPREQRQRVRRPEEAAVAMHAAARPRPPVHAALEVDVPEAGKKGALHQRLICMLSCMCVCVCVCVWVCIYV